MMLMTTQVQGEKEIRMTTIAEEGTPDKVGWIL